MARDIESLTLRMSADLRRFEKSMDAMRATADRRLNEVERRAMSSQRNLSRIMGQAGDGMVAQLRSGLAGLAPTLAAAFSTAQVIKYADSYTALQNRLKAAGLEGAALARVEDQLYEVANRNGLQVQATAELYQRASLSRQRLGATEAELLALVSGTAAALKVQGTSAEAASGPLLQLGQVLGGAKVQAEEYNSLIDGLPVLLQAAAKGSARFGGDVATLTQKVKAGEVTSQEFFRALLKGFPEIEAQANAAATTVGAALQTLNNQLGRYVGQTDSGLSATQRLAQGIEGVANNLDKIIPAIGALAALIGVRYTLALTANSGALIANAIATARLTAFQTAMTASMTGTSQAALVATGAMTRLNAAMAANPIGAVIVAVAALAAGFVLLSKRYGEAHVLQRQLDQSAADTANAMLAYEDAARAAANATGENAKAARDNVAAMRTEAISALQSAQALRVRTAALAAARAEAAQEAEAAFFRSNGGKGAIEARGGQLALAQAAARTAERQAAEAARAARDAQSELARIDNNIRDGAYRFTPSPAGDDDKKKRDRSAERQAQLREDLALEEALNRARADGDKAAIKAAEEQQRLAQLTRQYESAGYEDARARAMEQLALLNVIEDREEAEERAAKVKEMAEKSEERRLRNAEGSARAAQLERDFALEVLETQDRLALTEQDSLNIRRQILAIRQEERRAALEAAAADQQATEAERAAARRALAGLDDLDASEVREFDVERGRNMAASIVDVLRSDNIWEEAGRRFKDAAWDGLEQLLSQIFSSMGGGKGGGGNWLAQLGSAIFGGFRASGGPVSAGRAYVVGERRPELFVPNTSGTIIPSVNAAMASLGGAGGGRDIRISINLEGANGDETIRQIAYEAAAQGVGVAIGANRLASQRAQRRQRQRFA